MRIYKTRADFDKLQSEGSSSLVAGTVCTITDEPTNPMYVYQGGVWNSTVTATTNHVTGGIELSAGEGVKIGELSPTARSSRTVIVDTDFWTDCDDVGALRICTYAEKMGIWDVAAYLLNTTYIDNPGALDRVMYYDGRKTNLIAVPKTSHVPAGSPPYQATMVNQQRRVGYATNCPDAVTAARTVLAAAGDASVEWLSLGFLTNLHELMTSPADSISAMAGAELFASKVKKVWCIGQIAELF